MKNLNHPIEEKADLDQLGLISIEYHHSSELDTLINHLNLQVRNLIYDNPTEYPFEGNFEYSIIHRIYNTEYNRNIKPHQLELSFHYKYKGNIILPLIFDLRYIYNKYDGWIGDKVLNFNHACYSSLISTEFQDIIKGNKIISENPNHFLYNLTYKDTLKLTNNKQIELEL